MKVVRKLSDSGKWHEANSIALFVKKRLPVSLEARYHEDGYGYSFEVVLKERRRVLFNLLPVTDRVAVIDDSEIELYHPQYFSDFEDIIREYERIHPGKEITLTFWESV